MNWLKAPLGRRRASRAPRRLRRDWARRPSCPGSGCFIRWRASGRAGCVWLGTWALSPFVLRSARHDRAADIPRPVSPRRCAGVRAPRRRRSHAASGDGARDRAARRGGRVDGRRARAVVLGERRKLARGGLEERRRDRARAARRGGRGRRCSLVGRAGCEVLRRRCRRRLVGRLDLGDHLVRDGRRHLRGGAACARLRRSRAASRSCSSAGA